MLSPLMGSLGPLRIARNAITYLLRDEFTTAQAAPLPATRVCEPGPGLLNVTDTGNKLSIVGGELVWTSATGNENPATNSALFARQVGRAFRYRLRASSGREIEYWRTAGGGTEHGMETGQGLIYVNGASIASAISATTAYVASAIILRGAGAYYIQNGKLVWVDNAQSTASLSVRIGSINTANATNVDYMRVLDLAPLDARFASDFGLATTRLAGSVSAGATFTHTSDFWNEFAVTTRPTAGNMDYRFRKQDASNHWMARVNSAGDFSLQEVVAGITTQRANAAGAVSSGHRCVVVAEGAVIRGYSNNTPRWTYSNATNFQTATSGDISTLGTGGVLSEAITYPRTITLPDV